MNRMAAQFHRHHTQNGPHDHVDSIAFHQHTQNQQQDIDEEQDDVLIVGKAQEESRQLGGDLVVSQHQAENGGN